MLWTTTYPGDALDALRAEGYPVTDEDAAHLTPGRSTTTFNFYGTYSFDVETAPRGTPPTPHTDHLGTIWLPRRKGPDSLRPLRGHCNWAT